MNGVTERGRTGHAFDHDAVTARYEIGGFVERVEAAFARAGFGDAVIPWDALAPLDQFHVGGAAATAWLAEKLGIGENDLVLDLGCGLGGPARHLASARGCAVVGIDLSPSLIEVANTLTRRTGLSGQVSHQVADACHLPFPPGAFDIVWTQHVVMNIADRPKLYRGIHDVLRPGGKFAMYDVVAGDAGALHYPVPWAREAAGSCLLTPEVTRLVLEESGFKILDWFDATEAGQAWFAQQAELGAARPDHLKQLALPAVMGPEFATMTANLARNFREGRGRLLQAIVQRA